MVLITIVMGVYKPTNITGRPLLVTKHKIHPKIRPENMSKISRGYLPTAVESPVKLVQKKHQIHQSGMIVIRLDLCQLVFQVVYAFWFQSLMNIIHYHNVILEYLI